MNNDEDIRARITPRNNARLVNRPQPPAPYSRERVLRPTGRDLKPDAAPATPTNANLETVNLPQPNYEPVPDPQIEQPAPASLPITPPAQPNVPAGISDQSTPSPDQITSPIFNAATQNDISKPVAKDKPIKPKLPIGIYIVAAITLISFCLSFFNTSQTRIIYTIVLLLNLILVIGLLLRKNLARKLMVFTSGLLIAVSIGTIIMLFGLQQSVKKDKANYETAISHLQQQSLTDQDRQNLSKLQTDISSKQKQLGKVTLLTYLMQAVYGIEGIAVIAYLTRPKVASVFKSQ